MGVFVYSLEDSQMSLSKVRFSVFLLTLLIALLSPAALLADTPTELIYGD